MGLFKLTCRGEYLSQKNLPIWGFLKLSGTLNQKMLKLPLHTICSKSFENCMLQEKYEIVCHENDRQTVFIHPSSLVTLAFILYTHVTAFLSFWNASKWNTAPVKSSAKEAKIQFNLRYVRGSCIEKWEISTKSTSSYFKRNGFIVEVKLKKQWCDYFAKAEFGKLTPCLHWRINC